MVRIVVLGGYGEMGRISVMDLVETCKNCEIIVAGRDKRKAENFAKSFRRKNIKGVQVDVNNYKQTVNILKGADVVINATQYYMNLQVMKATLSVNVNYVDLGGLFHMTRRQLKLHQQFKRKGLIAILGCGATPGITNVMAIYGAKFLDRIDEIHVLFGGKDFTRYNVPFVVPYSMHTVFDEFTAKPAVFAKGKMKFVKPISGETIEHFPKPIGDVACFYTLHSEIATFPTSFKNKGVKECSFKAGFDKDFIDKVKFLVDTALASTKPIKIERTKIKPRDIVVRELNRFCIFCKPQTKIKANDVEILRVKLKGKKGGKNVEVIVDCITKSNPKWNVPAGSMDTGVPPSIITQMIAKDQIKQKGVLPPELCVDPEIFFKELAKRNIKVYTNFRKQ